MATVGAREHRSFDKLGLVLRLTVRMTQFFVYLFVSLQYYQSFMPFLMEMLRQSHAQGQIGMQSKAIECLTLIGMSVGKEMFAPDAPEVVRIVMEAQRKPHFR